MKILTDLLVRKETNAFVRGFTQEKLTLLSGINKCRIIYVSDHQVQRQISSIIIFFRSGGGSSY